MTFDLDALKESFDKNKPKLQVVNHGSNVCGVVAPMGRFRYWQNDMTPYAC